MSVSVALGSHQCAADSKFVGVAHGGYLTRVQSSASKSLMSLHLSVPCLQEPSRLKMNMNLTSADSLHPNSAGWTKLLYDCYEPALQGNMTGLPPVMWGT